MALNNTLQKSQQWASVLQSQVKMDSFIGMKIADTKFEWDFDWNGTVNFRRQAKVTLQDMASGSSEIAITKLVETNETFTLSKFKGFATEISDEEFKEMDIDPNSQVMQDAKEAFARAYDLEIFGNYASASMVVDDGDLTTASNSGWNNPIIVSKDNIFEALRRCNLKMDKAVDSLGNKTGLPNNNRWVVLSPDETFFLDDAPQLLRSTTMWDNIVTGWYKGRIVGLDIYSTNLLSEVSTVRYCLFGQGKPICFGANIKPKIQFVGQETQANTFLNYLKGMTKYWTKVFSEWAEKLGSLQVKVV